LTVSAENLWASPDLTGATPDFTTPDDGTTVTGQAGDNTFTTGELAVMPQDAVAFTTGPFGYSAAVGSETNDGMYIAATMQATFFSSREMRVGGPGRANWAIMDSLEIGSAACADNVSTGGDTQYDSIRDAMLADDDAIDDCLTNVQNVGGLAICYFFNSPTTINADTDGIAALTDSFDGAYTQITGIPDY